MTDEKTGSPEMTQVFGAVGEDSLQRSLDQLGPRTTVHGTGDMSAAGLFGDKGAPVAFKDWANQWFVDHIPVVEEKSYVYGSNSLAKKGHRFAKAVGQNVTFAQALELGCEQYLVEKSDRVEDAILRGQLPTEDTLVDAAVYALMALFIRQHGHWG